MTRMALPGMALSNRGPPIASRGLACELHHGRRKGQLDGSGELALCFQALQGNHTERVTPTHAKGTVRAVKEARAAASCVCVRARVLVRVCARACVRVRACVLGSEW